MRAKNERKSDNALLTDRRKRSLATTTSPPLPSLIVFNAYSVTSAYISSGVCVTTSGRPITLPTPYSFAQKTPLPSSILRASALSAFVEYLGFTTCVGGGEPAGPETLVADGSVLRTGTAALAHVDSVLRISPATLVPVDSVLRTSQSVHILIPSPTKLFNSSVTSTLSSLQTSPSASAVQRAKPSTGLSSSTKIGIGIGGSTAGTIILLLAIRDFLRYRKRKNGDRAEKQEATSGEPQPYFQQKGELEDEARRRHELEAAERRYELEENIVNEMPTLEMDNDRSADRRQELIGEEHCKELDGSDS